MSDQSTGKIAEALHLPFKQIGAAFTDDYGGTMEHLWVDFELIRSHCALRGPRSFRFQKKVGGGRCKLTGLETSVSENVGHYSVMPDFDNLLEMTPDQAISYSLSLIHASTILLEARSKKLGGFQVAQFRSDFLSICETLGYQVGPLDRLAGDHWRS